MKKRVIALLLAVIMIFSFAACGGKKNAEPKTEEKEFTSGVIEDNVYTSEDLGMKFTLPDNWLFLNEEQISVITGVVQDLTDDKELAKAMEQGASIFDMYAMAADGSGQSANITVSNLGALYGSILDEEKYIEAVKGELEEGLKSIGMEEISVVTFPMTVAGANRSGVACKGTFQGVTIYEKMFCVKFGQYMYCVTCSAASDEDSAKIVQMFTEK